jgi:S-adenosyl-L-methionine hydrolase (adenosine-forming)
MSHTNPLITLLTDFGAADHYVSAMKAVILTANASARIVDITHEIPPHDIEAGAFTLLAACANFPPGTIHVAVVDPGVGSSRRPILIAAGKQCFVGPDNGLFSYVSDALVVKQTIELTNTKYFRTPLSQTFNGRDLFAPVAAALSLGGKPRDFGSPITDLVKLKPLQPEVSATGNVKGRVLHIDRFGNCITNITREHLSQDQIAAGARLRIKGKTIRSFRNYFSEPARTRDKVFAIWGSTGFLEVAATNESAAALLRIQRGDAVSVQQN